MAATRDTRKRGAAVHIIGYCIKAQEVTRAATTKSDGTVVPEHVVMRYTLDLGHAVCDLKKPAQIERWTNLKSATDTLYALPESDVAQIESTAAALDAMCASKPQYLVLDPSRYIMVDPPRAESDRDARKPWTVYHVASDGTKSKSGTTRKSAPRISQSARILAARAAASATTTTTTKSKSKSA